MFLQNAANPRLYARLQCSNSETNDCCAVYCVQVYVKFMCDATF
jgi:hypothetical protein